jgi:plasmid maintenance system antidote protein VapI
MGKKPRQPVAIDQQLRQAILDSGLSAYRLQRTAGVATPVITRFLAGQRDLHLKTAAKLARALGLELRPIPASRKVKS